MTTFDAKRPAETRTVTGQPVERVPESWLERGGSQPEYWIYRALYRAGYKEGPGFLGFRYQSKKFGGRLQRGGAIVDFEIFNPHVGINVQSNYFHSRTTNQRAHDRIQRAELERNGFRLEFIDETEAVNRPDAAVREALAGTRGRGPIGI